MPKKPPSSTFPNRDLELLYEVGCLRYVQRVWRQFLNPDFANLSEHILRVAWIALIIAQHEKNVDTGKIIKMVLVHDLAESRGVDVHYVSRQFATRHEEAALENTLKDTSIETEFLALNQEYEERQTLEAKIVKDADNLDVDFELKEQAARGFTIGAKFQPMRKKVAETKLFTKTAKQIWDKLQKSDPHDWHWNSVNRFNSGDWKK